MKPQKQSWKISFLLTLAFICGGLAHAQQISVSGTVTDASGEPIIGATVMAEGTANGTSTDLDGNYSITADALGMLKFSYVGYTTQSIAIEGRSVINVTMTESAELLDELVVVGYGTMKKSDLTGAVGSIGGKDIKDVPVNNVGQALQGKIAGVNIVGGEKPGDNVTIKVRGLGSINNSDPLVVIDGVPTDLGLNAINPQDIERLDVLKDASATAIYGSRGANGVVMITTRKGVAGTSRLSVSANVAFSNVSKKMSLLDAAGYASLSNDMLSEAGHNTNPAWADPSSLTASTNWVDELLRTGVMQNYNVSYSGGNDKAHYYFSAGFLNQSGVVDHVNYRRFTFQANNDVKLKSWLKLSNNLLFSADIKKQGSYSMWDAMRALPTFPVKDEDGEWSGPDGNSEWYGSVRNPVGSNDMYRSSTNGYNFLANIAADITLVPEWLQFRSLFGFDGKFWFDDSFSPKYNWKPTPVEESTQYNSSNRNFTYLWDNYFTFDHKFGKNSLNVMAGMSAQWNHAYWMNGQMNGFLFDTVHQLTNGEKIYNLDGSQSEWALLSYMARANYDFDNRYFLTATVRRDGSSRFGPSNRWGTFPSMSAAWKISSESFFPQDIALNDLKLRLGWGKTGSQASVGNYDYIQTLVTLLYPFGTTLDNAEQSALYSQVLANSGIHWEEIEQFNAGVDLSFFNSRINVSLDGYIKNTKQMLVKAAFPITTGFEDTFDTYTNAGKVRNIGWELSASSVNLTGELGWETDLNVTYNKNKIIDLNSDTPLWRNQFGGAYATMLAADYPINVFYGYVTDGIFQNADEVKAHAVQPGAEAGDIRFRDLNNDGIINENDRTVIGNPNPTWLFSVNNRLTYKGFELSIYLQGVAGNKIYNRTRSVMESMSAAYNQAASTANRWYGEGTSNSMPRAVWADPNGNNRISDRWVENGSYLRLKNVTLAYNFPDKWLKRINFENARILVSCENVATITGYKGLDPEVGIDGIDYSSFPPSRVFNIGLSVNF
ncbi:SusC/RagA family TonB-linked outer membrane protein [Lepagella muris]|uniref:TonB-dependent receptor n=1 Tax=Lepagella muris TaxID=3032870 RepID=A0AC61RG54_9BACT|nr:TonB-dependent receptor [Lepagella muris]TGY77683.1 TonB-dependent receptor [Lepagella muris]THG50626.1 TonB-dependent receptor [Bacteroidales bacterium]TKC55898.1 TonB-dependent receptor [Bacteroidales bacterium]